MTKEWTSKSIVLCLFDFEAHVLVGRCCFSVSVAVAFSTLPKRLLADVCHSLWVVVCVCVGGGGGGACALVSLLLFLLLFLLFVCFVCMSVASNVLEYSVKPGNTWTTKLHASFT